MTLAQEIKQQSCRLGFDLVGITDAEAIDDCHVRFFTDWLSRNYAGRMDYMHRNLEKRINPCEIAARRSIGHRCWFKLHTAEAGFE